MKIGIFGDSFGDDYHVWPNPYDGVGPSWIEYLQSCGHEVENFSCGATALFYSYDLFIKNYQKYDKVIFVVTHPSRYYVYVDQYQCNWYHIGQVKKSLDACEDPIKKIKLQAVYDFYANLQDDEYDYHVHRLLLKDIRKKHNSVLTIPCFRDSWVIGMPLIFISEFEAKFWKLPEVLPNRKKSVRCSQMPYVRRKQFNGW